MRGGCLSPETMHAFYRGMSFAFYRPHLRVPRKCTRPRPPLVEMLAILSSAASGFVAQPRGAAFAASRAAAVRHAGACLGASDNFYSFSAKELVSNADAPLSQYEGQVSLVVNVASK